MVEFARHVSAQQASVTTVELAVGRLAAAATELPIYPPRSCLQLVMQPSDWPVDERWDLMMLARTERS